MLVDARLVGSHIAQYVLEGSAGTFYLGIGWEEWFVGKYLPVDYLSVRSGIFVGFAFLVADQFSMLSCHSSCILFHIAHIVLADIIVHVVSLTSLAGTFQLGIEDIFHAGGRPHLVIVANKVYFVGSSVAGTVAPVVYYIIKEIELSGIISGSVQSATHTPVSSFVVGKQVVVERAYITTDGCSITMLGVDIILMTSLVECFGDEVVLERDVLAVAAGESLVDGPAYRTVVDDGIVAACSTQSVEGNGLAVFIEIFSQSETDEAEDAF
ncbi:Uncharacterised protein [Segatella copri]|nr:Uncharacterised protein [Segatella copri]